RRRLRAAHRRRRPRPPLSPSARVAAPSRMPRRDRSASSPVRRRRLPDRRTVPTPSRSTGPRGPSQRRRAPTPTPSGASWPSPVNGNGKARTEPYGAKGAITTPVAPTHIPAHHYWVMGDNRSVSEDSRYFGSIPQNLIVGRVFFQVWPVSEFGLV